MKYYKFLMEDNKSPFSNFDYTRYLPKNGKPGKWLPEIEGELISCERGYHACTNAKLIDWINSQLYEVEFYNNDVEVETNKVVGRKIRFVKKIDVWDGRKEKWFDYCCAEQLLAFHDFLSLYENVFLGDMPLYIAIETPKRFASGDASQEDLDSAWKSVYSAMLWADVVLRDYEYCFGRGITAGVEKMKELNRLAMEWAAERLLLTSKLVEILKLE